MSTHGRACFSVVSTRCCVRTLTKNIDNAVDSSTSLGFFYDLCRSPFTAGHHKPPGRADRAVPFIAWSRYAPLTRGASRSRCGTKGVRPLRWPSHRDDGSLHAWATPREGHPVNRATRPGKPRRVASADTARAATDKIAANNSRTLSAEGGRGEVRFFLKRVAGGLYVEREEIPRRGLRTQQSVEFPDAERFKRWCDNDPIRFEHPLLHINLQRDADDLWRTVDDGDCASGS